MTKSKKLVSRMMFALLVLTLVSFCFVGFTFARYISTGSGSATVNVAKWEITFKSADNAEAGSTEFTVAKLSPSKAEYSEGGAARTNSTGVIKVATIANTSDVAAHVTITTGNDVTLKTKTETTSGYDANNAKKPFSIKLYSDAAGTAEISATGFDLEANNDTQDIYAVVTWTSDVGVITGSAADENDTMIAQNVESISWTISYTATQDSQTTPANSETPTT